MKKEKKDDDIYMGEDISMLDENTSPTREAMKRALREEAKTREQLAKTTDPAERKRLEGKLNEYLL